MNRFEDAVRTAVRDLADEARTGQELTAVAVAIGRRIRRRRRAIGMLAATVACVAVSAPLLVNASFAPPGRVYPSPSEAASPAPTPYPRSSGETTLPRAVGVPGAADRPDLVGTDPGIIHFDVRVSVVPGLILSRWSVRAGEETAYLAYDPKGDTSRDLAITVRTGDPTAWPQTEPTGTTVRGRPATLTSVPGPESVPPSPPTWQLLWQPVDGLVVTIVARDRTDTVIREVAETLRLDVAQSCVQPFRATAVPPGYTWTGSHVGIRARPDGGALYSDRLGVWWYSGLTFARAGGPEVSVGVAPLFPKDPASTKDAFRPNRTVGGQPAMWVAPGTTSGLAANTLEVERFHQWFDLYVTGAPEAEAVTIATGLHLSGDTARPDTWPARTVP